MKPISFLMPEKLKKSDFKVIPPSESLFKPDYSLLKELRCPIHLTKMRWNRANTILICAKNRKHKSHVFTRDMYEGKNLEAFKEQRRIDLR